MAQSVEHVIGNDEVISSILITSSKKAHLQKRMRFLLYSSVRALRDIALQKKHIPKNKKRCRGSFSRRFPGIKYILFYAQDMVVGFSSVMITFLRKATAFCRPSSMVIRLSSCSMESTRS